MPDRIANPGVFMERPTRPEKQASNIKTTRSLAYLSKRYSISRIGIAVA